MLSCCCQEDGGTLVVLPERLGDWQAIGDMTTETSTDLMRTPIPLSVFVVVCIAGAAAAACGSAINLPILISVGLFVACGGLACFIVARHQLNEQQKRQLEKQREEELRDVAQELGFEFLDRADRRDFIDFELYHMGTMRCLKQRNGKVRNVMRKSTESEDVHFYLLDYVYTADQALHSVLIGTTCAVIVAEEAGVPDFVCRPESWHDSVLFGGDGDIGLPDRPAFSKLFHLSCPDNATTTDEAAVITAFNKTLTDYLESHEDVTIESSAGRIAIYREGVMNEPGTADMSDFIGQVDTIMRFLMA